MAPNAKLLHLLDLYPNNPLLLDISRWQGEVDFFKAKLRGVVGVYTRVTIADYYTDPLVKKYAKDINEAGLFRGDYHVTRADIKPIKQMDRYYRDRPSGDTPPALGIVLDNEISGRNITVKINKKKTEIQYKKFSRAGVTDNVLACKEIVERRDGIVPENYTYPYFFWDYLSANDELMEMPLWLAHYGVDVPGRLSARKDIFDMLKISRSSMIKWQALADGDNQGEFFGSSAHGLDVNLWMGGDGTLVDFMAYYGLTESDVPEPGDDPDDCKQMFYLGVEQGRREFKTQAMDSLKNL